MIIDLMFLCGSLISRKVYLIQLSLRYRQKKKNGLIEYFIRYTMYEKGKYKPRRIHLETTVSADFQSVISNFDRKLFDALKPPLIPLKLIRYDGEKTGDEIHLALGFGQKWISLITDHGVAEKEWFFVDEGKVLPWPLRYWKHVHKVLKTDNNVTMLIDDISFGTGYSVLDAFMYPFLYLQLSWRKPTYKKFFGNIHDVR